MAQAPLDAIEHMSEESLDLRWFGLETALGMDLDESLLRAIGRLE